MHRLERQWHDGAPNVTNVGVSCAINNYTLPYDANSATGGSVPSTQNANHDSSVTLVGDTGSLVRTNYFLVRWNTAANGSGTRYLNTESLTLTSNTTLYAEWAQPTTFHVATTGSDTVATGWGTAARPFATIARAISLIGSGTNATGQFVIRVAAGTYNTNATISWGGTNSNYYQKSLAIYGGYNAGFTSRSPSTTPSTLNEARNASSTLMEIIASTGLNRPSTGFVLDGLDFTSGTGDINADYIGLSLSPNDSSAEITGCTFVMDANLGGTLTALSLGNPSGSNTKTTTIRNNIFTVLNSYDAADSVFGIVTGSHTSSANQTYEIYNNFFHLPARAAVENRALSFGFAGSGNTYRIRNNTFVAQLFSTNDNHSAIEFPNGMSRVHLDNNLFYDLRYAASLSTNIGGIYIESPTALSTSSSANNPLSLKNNFFYRAPTATVKAPIAIQSASQNWETSELNNGADTDLDLNDIATASNNYQGIVSFTNTSTGVLTLTNANSNWTVGYGGLNGAAESPAWTFSADFAGTTRTLNASNGFGWSIGAYENDSIPNAPSVVTFSPANGDLEVDFAQPIVVDFELAIDPTTINTTNVTVVASGSGTVAGSWAVSNSDCRITFTPTTAHPTNENVTVTVTTSVLYANGNAFPSTASATFTTLDTSELLAHWKFDGNGNDSSGNGNTLTNVDVTFDSSDFVKGTSAADFNGSSSALNTAGNFNLGQTFTITVWVKMIQSSFPHLQGILTNAEGGMHTNGLKLFINEYGTTNLRILTEAGDGSSGVLQGTGINFVEENRWRHLAFTVDRNQTGANVSKMFFDGTEGEQSVIGTVGGAMEFPNNFANNLPIYMGRFAPDTGFYFRGSMDDFRIYNRILTPSEIAQIATQD